MKRQKLFAAALSIAVLTPLLQAEEELAIPLSVAVLDFKDGSEALKGTGASASALLQVRLTTDSDAILVERAELNEVLAEQELTLSGSVTPAQAAKVAQLTGAEVLVSGRVFAVQDQIHLVAKVISSSSSRMFGATASYERGDSIDDAIAKLGKDVSAILKDKTGDLRGAESLQEQTLAKVKASLKDGKPQRIFIEIPEQVVQTEALDPAARTEIARTLEAAGWQVVNNRKKADLIIKGEAFAETAVRRGNLWFSRARLEFSVSNKQGKTLKTDRVVCGDVDLAQAVSAKGALQKAGLLAAPLIAEAWVKSSTKGAE